MTLVSCPRVESLTLTSLKMSKSPGSAPAPTLGLNIDRCISKHRTREVTCCESDVTTKSLLRICELVQEPVFCNGGRNSTDFGAQTFDEGRLLKF